MKRSIFLPLCIVVGMSVTSCADNSKSETASQSDSTTSTHSDAKADPAQLRSEISAIEASWAAALNARDTNALMTLYADDAVSMPYDAPMVSGKAAIQKEQEKGWANAKGKSTISFETLDVYGQGDVVTEVGKSIVKDSTGKVIEGGKYIAVFEKRDGKYLCIREIYNNDAKK